MNDDRDDPIPPLSAHLGEMNVKLKDITTWVEEVVQERNTALARCEKQRLRLEQRGKMIEDYERELAEAKRILRACGTSRDSPDTCGVCGKHFADCDSHVLVDHEEFGEVEVIIDSDLTPPDAQKACPGAQARSVTG